MKKISGPLVREVIGDRDAFWKAFKEEMDKPPSEQKIVLWNEMGKTAMILDESSIRKYKPVKELLCFLKFGKCDPKTLEIYEKLKDPSQEGDD